jgi:DNA modification methylase
MIQANRLYFGDNLEFLRNQDYFPSESVDLVYLDPPFNSAQSYNILFKEEGGTPARAGDEWRGNFRRKQKRLNTSADWQIPIGYEPAKYGVMILQ